MAHPVTLCKCPGKTPGAHSSPNGQYEDKRCNCVCPCISAVLNNTGATGCPPVIDNVPPNKWVSNIKYLGINIDDRLSWKIHITSVAKRLQKLINCVGVILPRIKDQLQNREQEFCSHCECKYENRNTTIIKRTQVL
ncbi:Uncharacterized protein OBRU01_11022 [Operophtera brumata]|uniref:Uncharacterized protein n=1 Tax=Operophtera brumata TaxID=104452 RepID=A0A0L7LCW0_OPEBR|nr:Uncharacterized protein OBRU01_11022 [Operophtera brumata]